MSRDIVDTRPVTIPEAVVLRWVQREVPEHLAVQRDHLHVEARYVVRYRYRCSVPKEPHEDGRSTCPRGASMSTMLEPSRPDLDPDGEGPAGRTRGRRWIGIAAGLLVLGVVAGILLIAGDADSGDPSGSVAVSTP